eukprot:49866-Lingulodinium_polyedra.AAC.1
MRRRDIGRCSARRLPGCRRLRGRRGRAGGGERPGAGKRAVGGGPRRSCEDRLSFARQRAACP